MQQRLEKEAAELQLNPIRLNPKLTPRHQRQLSEPPRSRPRSPGTDWRREKIRTGLATSFEIKPTKSTGLVAQETTRSCRPASEMPGSLHNAAPAIRKRKRPPQLNLA